MGQDQDKTLTLPVSFLHQIKNLANLMTGVSSMMN